jgi:hypothetical protein
MHPGVVHSILQQRWAASGGAALESWHDSTLDAHVEARCGGGQDPECRT